ncbi:MAG: glycosyltransferase family 39 protein [Nanoarchaeota archaeon]|nr:glycosyltransferase family 39 protein [Nanoarchaeota archaeon]
MNKKNDFINKLLNFLFNKNNGKWILVLFIIAIILRIIAANNLTTNADEMLHATHAIDISKAKVLQIMDEDPVWFYLTDLGYKLFGVSMFSGRLLSILFGALSVLIIYLLGAEMFNKKVGFISAFILTFSPFYLINTLAEMDIAMTFFILLSAYLMIRGLKEENKSLLILSYIFFGIAVLTKTIAATFLPAFVIFFIYFKYKKGIKILSKSNVKQLFIFAIILLLLLTPIFTFNYLLYKDKGIVDVQFARFLGVGKEVYASIEGTMKPFSVHDLFFNYQGHKPGIYEGLKYYYIFDIVTFILGIGGLLISFRKRFSSSLFLSLLFIFPFTFLAGTSILTYHFSFGVPIFALFAANTLIFLQNKIKKLFKINKKIIFFTLMILLLISSFIILNKQSPTIFKEKSEVGKMMDFSKNIEDNSLVIVDARVYRGRIAWIFNDKHYLEASYLENVLNNINQLPGDTIPLQTYFIECIVDDCGWGSIANQPEFNQSMENIVDLFINISKPIKEITNSYGNPYFRIYKTNLPLKQSVLDVADSTHIWFYYPVRYKADDWFDKYQTHNSFDSLLDKFAHIILYLSIFIAILSIFYVFYLLIEK